MASPSQVESRVPFLVAWRAGSLDLLPLVHRKQHLFGKDVDYFEEVLVGLRDCSEAGSPFKLALACPLDSICCAKSLTS